MFSLPLYTADSHQLFYSDEEGWISPSVFWLFLSLTSLLLIRKKPNELPSGISGGTNLLSLPVMIDLAFCPSRLGKK